MWQDRPWSQQLWAKLYRFVRARVPNPHEAEELTQETYLRALRGGAAGEPPYPYLVAIAGNLVRDRWRRRAVRGQAVPLADHLPDGADGPEVLAWVADLMDRLPPEYRHVLELRIVQGYSRTETAARMHRSEAAVRGLQYRALQMLRDLMQDGGAAR